MAKCYDGPNPIQSEEDRLAVWKWALNNGVDAGRDIKDVGEAINQKFYGGNAKPEWIADILGGRKTPLRPLANDLWKKRYNRQVITQQANEIGRMAQMGIGPFEYAIRKGISAVTGREAGTLPVKLGGTLRELWTLPRSVAVFGHGAVFPVTHAGDMALNPLHWKTFWKGLGQTYWGSFGPSKFGGGKAFTAQLLEKMSRSTFEDLGLKGDTRSAYDLAIRSGVDMGPKSHPSGLIGAHYKGPAQRAWNILSSMRFEMWKKAMSKYVGKIELEKGQTRPTDAQMLEYGKQMADLANHATGSGKGWFANLGGALFGPKLTQSKVNRLTTDPIKTIDTFRKSFSGTATPAEKAVAWERLKGSIGYVVGNAGFLAANAGLLAAIGSKQKINFTDPTKSDWFGFKGLGLLGYAPGLHTEMRLLGHVLATSLQGTRAGERIARLSPGFFGYLANQPKEGKVGEFWDTIKDYGSAKITPSFTRPLEAAMAEDFRGRPLPWSRDEYGVNRYGKTDKEKPRYTWGEYMASVGPIPLEGPIGYMYDQLQKAGATKQDTLGIIKSLIVAGFTPQAGLITALGGAGAHIREEYAPQPKGKTGFGAGGRTSTIKPGFGPAGRSSGSTKKGFGPATP